MTSFILHLHGYFGRAVFIYSVLLQKRKFKASFFSIDINILCMQWGELQVISTPGDFKLSSGILYARDNVYYDTSISCSLLATCGWVQ